MSISPRSRRSQPRTREFQVAPEAEFCIYIRSLSRVSHTKRRLFPHRKCFTYVGRKSEKCPGHKLHGDDNTHAIFSALATSQPTSRVTPTLVERRTGSARRHSRRRTLARARQAFDASPRTLPAFLVACPRARVPRTEPWRIAVPFHLRSIQPRSPRIRPSAPPPTGPSLNRTRR